MLCGCTTTLICSGRALNSQRASITSSPLFIRLAESTEIFLPITQLGCATACAGVAAAMASADRVRNGPPEAVSHSAFTPACWKSPLKSRGSAWKIALCSESIGSSSAPLAAMASMNSWPETTRVSLLASRMRLPACAAASVAGRPAAPTIAAIRVSTSGAVATSVRASAPSSTVDRASPLRQPARAGPPPQPVRSSPRSAGDGLRHCSSMRSTCVAPVSAKISKRSG